jgi:hypothetical protein
MKIEISVKELNSMKNATVSLAKLINSTLPESKKDSEDIIAASLESSFDMQMETSYMKVDYVSENPMCEVSEEFFCDAMNVYKRMIDISVSPVSKLAVKTYNMVKGLPMLSTIYKKLSKWVFKSDEFSELEQAIKIIQSDVNDFVVKYTH